MNGKVYPLPKNCQRGDRKKIFEKMKITPFPYRFACFSNRDVGHFQNVKITYVLISSIFIEKLIVFKKRCEKNRKYF
jgi:hypothetical protein